MKKLHIYTSAACNYIPKVRMLFNSLRKFHPEAVLHLLLADERTELLRLENEPFDYVTDLNELQVENSDGWAFCHTIVELATAMKPLFLQQLLKREDCGKVLYLDPDMVVFSRLDDIINALDTSSITLTPHQTTPEKSIAAIVDNEICSLKHGVYNLGFIGVSNNDEGKRFADWWAHRVYYFCRSEIHNGLFTDQRWIDLVPAMFDDVAILKSSRHNVATWNITTRVMSKNSNSEYIIDDEPLGFYHFTGFDSGAHRIMAEKNGGNNPVLNELITWYEDSTKDLSKDPLSQIPWKYGKYSDGAKIESAARFLYRQRSDLQRAFRNPFDVTGLSNFKKWMSEQAPLEYPGIFDAEMQKETVRIMSLNITQVFDPDATQVKNTISIANRISHVMQNSNEAKRLISRGQEIYKTEGVRGLLRRI